MKSWRFSIARKFFVQNVSLTNLSPTKHHESSALCLLVSLIGMKCSGKRFVVVFTRDTHYFISSSRLRFSLPRLVSKSGRD